MAQSEYFVVGVTHVDLAWKRGRAEMSEMYEIVVVRLLDALERHPDFKYHVEQAAHFRELARRRPDLIERLKPHLQSGRLEMVGGMASTLETNLPNGESFVRNQSLGMKWVKENWGVDIKTGWLVDTFGVHAQVPQLLRGFGVSQLVANRFGGHHTRDLFVAQGIDGSEVTVAGWGSYAGYVRPENISSVFCRNWDDIEKCFADADALTGPGPFLVIPGTENEILVSLHTLTLTEERSRERPDQKWRMAVPNEFFVALEKTGRALPVVESDLNPEFTGCFSLRHPIRLLNRRVENRLLEAEKWIALAGGKEGDLLEEAWWQLAYVQFHDVFTGSHPSVIYHDVMRILREIEANADAVLQQAFSRLAPPPAQESAPDNRFHSVVLFNGLPWNRREAAETPLPMGWQGVARVTDSDGRECPFEVRDGMVRTMTETPAVGHRQITLEANDSAAPIWEPTDAATLENDGFRLDFDNQSGVGKLTAKPTGKVLWENAGSWLVAQRDDGNFQIENPTGPEVAASSGAFRLERLISPLGQTVRLSGEFPPLSWAGAGNHLRYQAEFFLGVQRPEIRLTLQIEWKGEASRVRLTLPTQIEAASALYEIPFGVVRRRPYSPRTNAKGEWPAHRFVALENDGNGIALANVGVGGVEVSGGTLYTTLLRAPKGEYAGMVADDTSAQHGRHEYRFSLIPYTGSWADAPAAQCAQELNVPLMARERAGVSPRTPSVSHLRLEPVHVVLSSVKAAENSDALIVRVYETAGREAEAVLTLPGAQTVWTSDLREQAGEKMPLDGEELRFTMRPFEIRTLIVQTDRIARF